MGGVRWGSGVGSHGPGCPLTAPSAAPALCLLKSLLSSPPSPPVLEHRDFSVGQTDGQFSLTVFGLCHVLKCFIRYQLDPTFSISSVSSFSLKSRTLGHPGLQPRSLGSGSSCSFGDVGLQLAAGCPQAWLASPAHFPSDRPSGRKRNRVRCRVCELQSALLSFPKCSSLFVAVLRCRTCCVLSHCNQSTG